MIEALSTAVSGLLAASKKVQAASSNIANASVPDQKPIESRDRAEQAGPLSPAGVLSDFFPSGASEVSIDQEVVNLNVASAAYKANAAVIKVTDEIDKTLRKALDTNA